MALPFDVAARLRPSVDPRRLCAVTLSTGAVAHVAPCMVRPRDILSGNVTPFQSATLRLRAALAAAELRGTSADVAPEDWSSVVLGALQSVYDLTRDEINAMLPDDADKAAGDMVQIAAIACGRWPSDHGDARRRALAAACLGLGDEPMTTRELAAAADFAWNNGRAPLLGG